MVMDTEKVEALVAEKNRVRRELADKKGEERARLWEKHRRLKILVRNKTRVERRRREADLSREMEKLRGKDAREYWVKLKAMAGIGKGGRKFLRR